MTAESPAPDRRIGAVRRLIVNADDLGLTPAITDAIFESHQRGIVTSTSLMSNLPGAAQAAERTRAHPGLGVGLHLNLTTGRPLSEGSGSLVDADGCFLSKEGLRDRVRRGQVDREEVRRELRAQMVRSRELGVQPTHLDGHNGIDRLPVVEEAAIELAREFGVGAVRTHFGYARVGARAVIGDWARCALRNSRDAKDIAAAWRSRSRYRRSGLRTSDGQLRHMRIYPTDSARKQDLLVRLAHLGTGTWELVVHPAPRDDGTGTAFAMNRQADFDLVGDPDVISALASECIELISYRDL